MINRRFFLGFDAMLVSAVLLICSASLLELSSITAGSNRILFTKQLIWILTGLVVFTVCSSIDYHVLADISPLLYFILIATLIYLLVFGREISGAKSWISFSAFNIQPSEFGKTICILFCSYYLFERRDKNWKIYYLIISAGIVLFPAVLIGFQPDLGTAICYMAIFLGMIFIGGIDFRSIIILFIIGLLLLPAVWFGFLKSYQKERILTFANPTVDPQGSGYQIIQSRIAVGSGEITGKGWKSGTQTRLEFIPEQATDFIFSVLAEEWGLMGVTFILGLYFYIIMRGIDIAASSRDLLGTYISAGFISVFAFQIIINTGMTIGLFPTTGIPLPFLSYGGSSTIINFAGMGLLMNINIRRFTN